MGLKIYVISYGKRQSIFSEITQVLGGTIKIRQDRESFKYQEFPASNCKPLEIPTIDLNRLFTENYNFKQNFNNYDLQRKKDNKKSIDTKGNRTSLRFKHNRYSPTELEQLIQGNRNLKKGIISPFGNGAKPLDGTLNTKYVEIGVPIEIITVFNEDPLKKPPLANEKSLTWEM